MRIVHMTTVHARTDTRIFLKQCRSLAAVGNEVTLVVADGLPNEERQGVRIIGVRKGTGRLARMACTTRAVQAAALAQRPEVCHLHDPELLSIARGLQKAGVKVIFDAHEDLPKQILSKPYLRPIARKGIAFGMRQYEAWICKRLDAVVAATPTIREKFRSINGRAVDINNFPLRDELALAGREVRKKRQICYVGDISEIRGILELVDSLSCVRSGARLALGGHFRPPGLRKSAATRPGWERVEELGWLGREEVQELLASSMAGVVTFLPVPNHIEAQPNKIFEYMSASLPVIGSDFPLWRELIQDNECGICVDPREPREIAKAVDWLVENPEEAERMGRNGRRAVEERYNWQHEEKKLLALYGELAA